MIRALRIAALLALISGAAFAALQFPALTGRVVDNAHVLTPAAISSLTQTLAEYENGTTNQVVVVTLPSLQGTSIEDYGYQLGRKWAIGQKGKDNGVLLIVAPKERKVRIEVGYGLEPVLTDAASSAIVQGVILPRFRDGHMEQGIVDGAQAILSVLGGKGAPDSPRGNAAPFTVMIGGLGSFLLILLMFWSVMRFGVLNTLLVMNMVANSRMGGSGFSRGGYGGGMGGGFSGGGFGGGGGSFGGGGASGGW